MKSRLCLMMAFSTVLAAGSCQTDPGGGPLFCDVERPRMFSAAEIQWRAANAAGNLKLDLATNETGEARCGWTATEGKP